MMYIRGQAAEYDDWANITGYSNWGWKGLKPFFLKHEGIVEPPALPEATDGDVKPPKTLPMYEKEHHGMDGPIKTSFPTFSPPIAEEWHQASKNAGLEWTSPSDAWGGKHLGGFTNLSTIDRSKGSGTRSYSVTGYFTPNAGRQNLMVLTEASVEKVVLTRDDAKIRATSVEFMKDGKKFTVHAKKEVILSAGTVQTPQILELSGIGSRALLEPARIDCIIENEAVGGHFEDHLMTGLSYDLVEGEFSLDGMAVESVAKEAMGKYLKGEGGPLANSLCSTGFVSLSHIASEGEKKQIHALAEKAIRATEGGTHEEKTILSARLQDPESASLQFLILPASFDPSRLDGSRAPPIPGVINRRVSVLVALTHPFSRGSIHINPTDPRAQPLIDPHYLESPIDVEVLSAGIRIADQVFQTSPLKEKIKGRVFPPADMDISDPVARKEYVRRHTRTEYHPIGTAGLGRVVDERLNVIGVDGLRVVDASVFPLSLSGNIMAPVYAVAEKAAEIIKRDNAASN